MGADVINRIGTTTTTWDLCGDGVPDLRAALSTRETTTIYKIGAKHKAECNIYDKLSATVDVALDLIARHVVEHLEGGGGEVTWGAVRGWMGRRQWAAATIMTMTMTTVSTTEEGKLSGGGNGNDNVQ
jgi:hypothetical protein